MSTSIPRWRTFTTKTGPPSASPIFRVIRSLLRSPPGGKAMNPPLLSPVGWLIRLGLLAGVCLAALPAPAQVNPLKPDSRKALLYTIAVTDSLQVSVFGEEDLSRISRVDARGMINLALIGEVKVFGLTLHDAEQAIARAYREGRYLRNPQVTVTVEVYAVREIS